jgi:hypothetical protein
MIPPFPFTPVPLTPRNHPRMTRESESRAGVDIESRILGLVYNLVEFPDFKNDLLKPEFTKVLR